MSEDADIDGIAAEYVLGSLPPAEHMAVGQRVGRDKALADAVAAWQRRLAPLSLHEPGIAPPPHAIERLLGEVTRQALDAKTSATVAAVRQVNRWRLASGTLAAASIALAVMLSTLIASQSTSMSPLVAILSKGADNAAADEPAVATSPVFLATLDPVTAALTVRQMAGRRPATERSFALWHSARDGAPAKFIGMLSKTEPTTSFLLPLATSKDLAGGTLTVSLEGSTIGRTPARPLLFTGTLEPTMR